jgi:parvulin-like peptidyl-prolyl isomerase
LKAGISIEVYMAKKPKKQDMTLTKKQERLRYRDQQARRNVLLGVIIGAIIVAGIIIAGVIYEYVYKPSSPVAVVNGERISTTEYQKMYLYQLNNLNQYLRNLETEKARLDPNDSNVASIIQFYDQLITQAQSQLADLPNSVLEDLIQDRVIRQGARDEGIVVTDEEVQKRIEELFGYNPNPPTPTPEPSPTPGATATVTPAPTPTVMTREEFNRLYSLYLENLKRTTGMSEAEYREVIRGLLYREKLQELIESRVPTSGEQVRARHILVADEETAKKVLERLKAGEDFGNLAQEFSQDTATKSIGGDLGWFPRGQMVKEFEDAAFALEVGQISEPVKTQFGYHIIRVDAHEMDRPYDPAVLKQMKQKAFNDWLQQAMEKANIQRNWSPDKVPATPTPAFVGS